MKVIGLGGLGCEICRELSRDLFFGTKNKPLLINNWNGEPAFGTNGCFTDFYTAKIGENSNEKFWVILAGGGEYSVASLGHLLNFFDEKAIEAQLLIGGTFQFEGQVRNERFRVLKEFLIYRQPYYSFHVFNTETFPKGIKFSETLSLLKNWAQQQMEES